MQMTIKPSLGGRLVEMPWDKLYSIVLVLVLLLGILLGRQTLVP